MPRKLTPTLIRNTRVKPGQRIQIMDSALPNFGMRIGPRKRTYFVMYRNAQGRQRRSNITMEQLADALPKARQRSTAKNEDTLNLELIAARIAAQSVLDRVSTGEDVADQSVGSVGNWGRLCELFLSDYVGHVDLSPKTASEYKRMLHKEVIPHWRNRKLKDVTEADVRLLLRDKGTKHKYASNRLLQLLRRVCSWGVEQGYLESNPAQFVKLFKESPRDRDLSNKELKNLWAAFQIEGYPFGTLCQLLLLTGCRRDELRLAVWPEIDLDEQLIKLSAKRTKGSRRHVVVLSNSATQILRSVPKINEYVFTSGGGPYSGLSKSKTKVDDLSRVENWRMHDFRKTVATNCAKLGVQPHIIERLLGHKPQHVTMTAYNHYEYIQERREALEAWTKYLHGVVLGNNIIPIRGSL